MAVESRCRQHGSRACCIYQALRLCRRFIQSSTPIRRCLMFFPIPEVATPCNPVPGLLYFPPTFAADRGFQNDPSRAWIGFSSVENGAFCIDVEKRADLVLSGISADTPLSQLRKTSCSGSCCIQGVPALFGSAPPEKTHTCLFLN